MTKTEARESLRRARAAIRAAEAAIRDNDADTLMQASLEVSGSAAAITDALTNAGVAGMVVTQ